MPPRLAMTSQDADPAGSTVTTHRSRLLEECHRLIDLYVHVKATQSTEYNIECAYDAVVIRTAREVEKRHVAQFDEMCSKLNITQSGAYSTFQSVCQELFSTGINWGRVSGFFAFGGALAEACIEKRVPNAIKQVSHWMKSFLEGSLLEWIESKGGWV